MIREGVLGWLITQEIRASVEESPPMSARHDSTWVRDMGYAKTTSEPVAPHRRSFGEGASAVVPLLAQVCAVRTDPQRLSRHRPLSLSSNQSILQRFCRKSTSMNMTAASRHE